MDKGIKSLTILCTFALVFCFSNEVLAQQTATSDESGFENDEEAVEVIPIATVNIHEPQIVSQNENEFKISFKLYNREYVQPGIKYSVKIIDTASGEIIDQKIFDEIVNLNTGEKISKEVSYTAPSFLKGDFGLWISAQNEKGTVFAEALAGEVKLNGSGEYLAINPQDCYLKVKSEVGDKKYYLLEGVDLAEGEQPQLYCVIKNNFKQETFFLPNFKTYYRTVFGNDLTDVKVSSPNSYNLKTAEKKELVFDIPLAPNSQAYDVVFDLVDTAGKALSNKIIFHYVIQGESASIQNLRLDKDYYVKGDRAGLTFNWVGAADSFMNARNESASGTGSELEIEIVDGNGAMCADKIKQNIGQEHAFRNMKLSALIKKDCINPIVSVYIKNDYGKVLDDGSFYIKTKTYQPVSSQATANKWNAGTVGILVITMSFVILLLVYLSRSSKKAGIIVFVFLSAGIIFCFGRQAKADTFNACPKYQTSSHTCATYNVNLDKDILKPGETLTASGSSVRLSVCSNGWSRSRLDVKFNNTQGRILDYGNLTTTSRLEGNSYGSASGLVESGKGDYFVTFTGHAFGAIYNGSYHGFGGAAVYKIPYEVEVEVDGVCGSSDGKEFTIQPTEKLCSSGTTSEVLEVPEEGLWKWKCEGLNGGDDANCSAYKLAPIPPVGAQDGECGTANGTFFDFLFSSSPALCNFGNITNFSGTGPWTWTCEGINGGQDASCSANKQGSESTDGACGAANGGFFEMLYSSSPNLCNSGSVINFSGTGPWTWTCEGINGGQDVNCSANKSNDGPDNSSSSNWIETNP